MPSAFEVLGRISASESLSDAFENISSAAFGASEAMDEAADEMRDIGASAEVGEKGVSDLDNEVEDLNRSLSIVQANAAGAGAAIKSLGSVDPIDIARDPDQLESLLSTQVPKALINNDVFRRTLEREIEVEGDVSPGGPINRALNNFKRSDTDKLGNLSTMISEGSEFDEDQAGALMAISTASKEAGLSMGFLEEETEEANEEMRETSVSSFSLASALQLDVSALGAFAIAAGTSERSVDDLEDEIDELRDSLIALGPALSTISANFGPFNFALQNVLVTLPVLFATIGPLVTVVLGFASALLVAGSALASFFAVGGFGLIETLEENFASITNRMEAMQAIAKGLGMAIKEAFQPLFEADFAGMSGIEFFTRIIQNTVAWLHMFAQAMAEILDMKEVENFFFQVEEALLGIGDATSGISMLEGLKVLIRDVMPMATEFVVFLIDHLPEAMRFMGEIIKEVGPEVAQLGAVLLDLVVNLTKVGAEVMSVLLPGLTALLAAISYLAEGFAGLMEAGGGLSDILLALVVTFLALFVAAVKVAEGLIALNRAMAAVEALGVALEASLFPLLLAVTGLVVGIALLSGKLDVLKGPLDEAIGLVLTLASAFALASLAGVGSISAITAALLGSGWGVAIIAIGLAVAGLMKLADAFGVMKVVGVTAIAAITAALVGSGWGILLLGALLLALNYWPQIASAAEDAIDFITGELEPLKRMVDAIFQPTIGGAWDTFTGGGSGGSGGGGGGIGGTGFRLPTLAETATGPIGLSAYSAQMAGKAAGAAGRAVGGIGDTISFGRQGSTSGAGQMVTNVFVQSNGQVDERTASKIGRRVNQQQQTERRRSDGYR